MKIEVETVFKFRKEQGVVINDLLPYFLLLFLIILSYVKIVDFDWYWGLCLLFLQKLNPMMLCHFYAFNFLQFLTFITSFVIGIVSELVDLVFCHVSELFWDLLLNQWLLILLILGTLSFWIRHFFNRIYQSLHLLIYIFLFGVPDEVGKLVEFCVFIFFGLSSVILPHFLNSVIYLNFI